MKDIEFRHLIGIGPLGPIVGFVIYKEKYRLERGKNPWRIPDTLQLNSEINP